MVFLVLLGVFGATMALCIGTWAFLYRSRYAASTRIPGDRSDASPGRDGEPPAALLRDTSVSDFEVVDRLLSGTSLAARLTWELKQAGSAARPDVFLLALGIGAVAGALVGAILGAWLGFPLALVGFGIPFLWLDQRQRRRRSALQEQLPEALDMLVRAMRAGYSLHAAMKLVGQETPAPLGAELLRFYDERRFGVETRAALLALQDRCRTAAMKMFVTAVLVHRDGEGSSTDVLSNLVEVLRQRSETTQRIDTLAAESRLAARVLTALALVAASFVVAMDIEKAGAAAPVDWLPVAYAVISVTLGYLILMRIARVDL